MTEEGRTVATDGAPAAIGPYAQGVWAAELFFSAGQIGLDPGTGELAPGGTGAEARRALENLGAVLRAAGLGPEDVVKTTVYLADMEDFAAVNEVYGAWFSAPYPARSTVQVARLPKDARVEIDLVARKRRG